jgi:hypothetical protein
VSAVLGGARSAAFSAGLGYRLWGGELNLGYQFRQAEDRDVVSLDQVWSLSGRRSTGTSTRVEGMGHLWSIGFRKSF